MKRIIIICEGPTETEFCKDVLYPYFSSRGIFIETPLIKKSGGGIVLWANLQKQIQIHLLQDSNAIVTTLIDYYGIQDKHLFPGWNESKVIADRSERMAFLEMNMKDALAASLKYRFLPYIQLHEFEALLFNDISVFDTQIPATDFTNRNELLQTLVQFPNPELINDTPENAPSYRLKRLINGYNKIVYGALLAQKIGLPAIRRKCPRFNSWITLLEA